MNKEIVDFLSKEIKKNTICRKNGEHQGCHHSFYFDVSIPIEGSVQLLDCCINSGVYLDKEEIELSREGVELLYSLCKYQMYIQKEEKCSLIKEGLSKAAGVK